MSENDQSADGFVALLFTDIEASSAWWERDPAAMRVALEIHDRIVLDAVERTGGDVFTSRGDGFGLCYETVDDAVAGARAAQVALASAAWPQAVPLAVRMGIHAGKVERRDHNLYGDAVNRAARVMDAGHGGQVLISGVAVDLLTHRVDLIDLGRFRLRGLSEPERIWWMPVTEVSAEPFPALRLRSADAQSTLPIPTRLRYDGATDFVGREEPVAQLMGAWEVASDGGSPVVVVAGDAGVGKTRLISEVASRVHADGGAVLYGRCDPHGASPLQPFDEALAGFGERVGGEEGGFLTPGDDAMTRHAVVDALAAVAQQCNGAMLVVDDVHWADSSTATLLEQLAVAVAPPSVAIVAAYRSTDVASGGLIEETLGALRRRIGAIDVQLGGLSLDEVERLVSAAAGHELGQLSSVVAELHDVTAGNAFFVGELLRHLLSSGAVSFDGERWTVRPLTSAGIPHGVRELVHERLASLPEKAVDALQAAAVFGQEFDVRHVAALAGVDVAQTLADLDPAVPAGLLREVTTSRLTFGHLLVQRVVYDDLPRSERVDAHVRAARAIEASPGAERHQAELAHHWGLAAFAGYADEAVDASCRAAEDSVASAAYDSAVDHYRRAFELAEELIPDRERTLDLRLDLAVALNMAGRLDEAKAEFVAAADEARATGRHDRLARAALGIGGDLPSTPPVDDVTIRLVEEALAHHPEPTRTRALLLCRLAEVRHRVDAAEERIRLTDEALAITERLADDALRAAVLLSRGRARHGPDATEEMLAISAEVDRLALHPPNDTLAIRSAQVRMTACIALGDLPAANNAARVMSVLAQRLRQPEYERLPLMWDAFRATFQGRFADARATVAELNAVLDVGRHSQTNSMVGALVMPVSIFRGHGDVAYAAMSDLDVSYREALLAWFAAESGDLDKATEHIARCASVAQIEADRNWSWWQAMVSLTTASAICGDRSTLAETRAAMTPWAHQHATAGHVTYLGSGHHHVGVAARELGDLDDAVEHLEAALVAHESIGAVPFAAWTQIELAHALGRRRATGDEARADELRSRALSTAESLRLESVLRRA